MKLQLNGNYGQRDSRWASVLLGYNTSSTYTIGSHGCLIDSLGNYIGKTPLEINQILKDNGGYQANTGNFIWSKSVVLGLTQVYQSPIYTSAVTPQGIAKMKALLDEGRPLLTHVDFNPATIADEQHWLLVMGYDGDTFFAFDPWSGTNITLDVYGGAPRAVIEFRAYDKILKKEGEQNTDTILVLKTDFENLVKKSTERDEWVKEFNTIEEVRNKFNRMQADIDTLSKQVKDLTDNNTEEIKKYRLIIEEKDKELSNKSNELLELEADYKKLNDDINNQSILLAKAEDENKILQTKIDSLIAGNQPITYTTKELVTMLIKSIIYGK